MPLSGKFQGQLTLVIGNHAGRLRVTLLNKPEGATKKSPLKVEDLVLPSQFQYASP
jgi:hypothetical protein